MQKSVLHCDVYWGGLCAQAKECKNLLELDELIQAKARPPLLISRMISNQ